MKNSADRAEVIIYCAYVPPASKRQSPGEGNRSGVTAGLMPVKDYEVFPAEFSILTRKLACAAGAHWKTELTPSPPPRRTFKKYRVSLHGVKPKIPTDANPALEIVRGFTKI